MQSITLADLYHIPYGSLLPMAGSPGLDVESRPNVARYGQVSDVWKLDLLIMLNVQMVEGYHISSVLASSQRWSQGLIEPQRYGQPCRQYFRSWDETNFAMLFTSLALRFLLSKIVRDHR